jgi:UDP-N-acetylmuramyl pentapeptide phosphotransferase/UDP-N-acetylglucosamine-1-phosphate transferase
VTPEITTNIIHTIYSTFAHNYIVFAYFLGLIIAIILGLKHPSRYTTLLIVGFALLVFSFEYDKHIIEGFRQQTLQSLITATPHHTLQKWVNLVISDVLSVFFYLFGWSLVFIALILGSLNSPSAPARKSL